MLTIRQSELDSIRRHGEETYPHECCGVMLGRIVGNQRVIEAVLRAANTRLDSPHNRYNIDPGELVRIQRESREGGLEIVGFYHSHPDHPARWSQTDLAEAHWIGCSYVITSVAKGRATVTNSFALEGTAEEDKRFVEEDIRVQAAEEFAMGDS
jgi:proteasome lid subunit RPN8/RPN11